PRGGTTWIAESVAHALGTNRLLWEPLQAGNPAKHGLGFSARPFIDEDSLADDQAHFFNSLLQARYANPHLLRLREQPSNVWSLFSGSRLVIKFVRGNGVVGCLSRKWQLPEPLVI